MKIGIELRFVDERVFLNFWNFRSGDDVICQIKDGKIMKFVRSPAENEEDEVNGVDNDPFDQEEITLSEFISTVKQKFEEGFGT